MTSSHNFLSMIFGIFGKFGIGICFSKNISYFFSSEKKNCPEKVEKSLVENNNNRKMKISIDFLGEIKKYSFTFPINIFHFFRSLFFRPTFFQLFSGKFFSDEKNLKYFLKNIFRSQMFQRFQKSYL